MPHAYAFGIGPVQRGGNGQNGDGSWPDTDGRGCPVCGAIRGGGHGGGCPNTYLRFDEDGNDVSRKFERELNARRIGRDTPWQPWRRY